MDTSPMLSIHASCLLYDLRYVLSAVRDHNREQTLCLDRRLFHVERKLAEMIGSIEDAATFIQELSQALGAEAEARLGSDDSEPDR